MSHRPLVFVSGLTVGDYFLWNWSLNSYHDVLALISGLTLPPLAVASLWLLALSVARLIARGARRPRPSLRRPARGRGVRRRQATAAGAAAAPESTSGEPPRKIAA